MVQLSEIASNLGILLDKDVSSYEILAAGVTSNYENTFWNPETNCLFDLYIRMKQEIRSRTLQSALIRSLLYLFLSLPYTMLSQEKEKAIIDRVEKDLLTPFGLRILSRDHPLYKKQYYGDAKSRDTAYHNGAVWPWLLGAYVQAYMKVTNYSEESFEKMKALLQGFDSHLETAGLGTIPEVFDGDYPYSPGGVLLRLGALQKY